MFYSLTHCGAAMWRYGQADIVQVAGYDSATFIRVCAFGTLISGSIAFQLPTNRLG